MRKMFFAVVDRYKKIFIIVFVSVCTLSLILGIIIGKVITPKVDIVKENEKLIELSKQIEDRVKRGDAMSTVNNTPISKIPPPKKN